MSAAFFKEHRAKIFPAVIVVAAAVAALIFWRPLAVWFSGESAEGGGETAAASKGAGAEEPSGAGGKEPGLALPSHSFEGPARERLVAAFQGYEQVRGLLARDSLEGLDSQAQAIRAALKAAQEVLASAPPEVSEAVSEAAAAAEALGEAGELDEARLRFGDLSKLLVALAESDGGLAEEWHVFECPMTDGFNKWFQRSERLENPYMGQEMLTCGSSSDWTAAPPPKEEHVHEGSGEIAYYTCAMHPSVKRDAPGTCPICSMDLTPVTVEEVETGTILVDEARRQRIGVRTKPVETRGMTLSVRAVGEVKYDETRLADVNLRMNGWVERLLVEETGQRVRRGQTLLLLYSPELYAAQLEHLTATRRVSTGSSDTFKRLAKSSRQKLRLLGMSEGRINKLEQQGKALEKVPIPSPASGYVIEKNVVEGAHVTAGQLVYRIADLSKVWIDAEVYESDLPHVSEGQKVEIELPYVPGKRFEGRVDYVYPSLQGATRTGRVRVVLDNPGLELKPDMYANVIFEVDLGERLAIPESAVLYTGPRRLVFVDLGQGRLRPKEVQLGAHADGYFEVTGGLEQGDVVVTSGNFLIAAESRIRSAASFWEGSHGSH